MDELRQRFETLDRVPAPTQWSEIERRASALGRVPRTAPLPLPWRSGGLERRRSLVLLAAAALLIALLAAVIAVGTGLLELPTVQLPSQTPPSSPVATPESTVIRDTPTPPPPPPHEARFVHAGFLVERRTEHFAVLLPDGRVLVGGGRGPLIPGSHSSTSYPAETEVWDPATATFSLSASLGGPKLFEALPRIGEHAVVLPDGRVLIVPAGCFCGPMPTQQAQIWTSDGGIGSVQAIPTLELTRGGHSVTLLADGRVLIAGGDLNPFSTGTTPKAEVWDPVAGTVTPTGKLEYEREFHRATLLADGRVLIVGGTQRGRDALPSVTESEIWDPATGEFSRVPSLKGLSFDILGGDWLSLITLPDGRVLILDRLGARTWDPTGGAVADAGRFLEPRLSYAATLLPSGQVLVVGGTGETGGAAPALASAELWDPADQAFHAAGTLATERQDLTATLLPDGRVLVVGGSTVTGPVAPAELWQPATPP